MDDNIWIVCSACNHLLAFVFRYVNKRSMFNWQLMSDKSEPYIFLFASTFHYLFFLFYCCCCYFCCYSCCYCVSCLFMFFFPTFFLTFFLFYYCWYRLSFFSFISDSIFFSRCCFCWGQGLDGVLRMQPSTTFVSLYKLKSFMFNWWFMLYKIKPYEPYEPYVYYFFHSYFLLLIFPTTVVHFAIFFFFTILSYSAAVGILFYHPLSLTHFFSAAVVSAGFFSNDDDREFKSRANLMTK